MPRTLPAVALVLLMLALVGVPTTTRSAPRPDDKAVVKDKETPRDKEAPKEPEPAKLTEGFVRFRVQEIDKHLKVGYSVCVADVNGDGKPDIVVADTDRVVWYENPKWQKRTLVENRIKVKDGDKETDKVLIAMDNVSIAPAVVDGKVSFVLAAGWTGRFDSKAPGTLQWLQRGPTPDAPWDIIPIPCDEPTIHRVKVADLAGDGKPQIVVAPLMGRDSTRAGNWMDGRPVKILAYKIPADPVKGPWTPEVVNETLHVVHGISPVPASGRRGFDLLAASYDGVTLVGRGDAGKWQPFPLAEGDQRTPLGVRGASEVKFGALRDSRYLGTVEPWHGGLAVVYTPGEDTNKPWDRRVIDKNLRWGHAIWCADLDGDGADELIVGVRDDPTRGDSFTDKRGVRIYKCMDAIGKKWDRVLLDPQGEVAVEDLAVADLNGDGRPDIIAVGRQTGNIRIYWNVR